MNQKDFLRAMPEMPDSFVRRMESTLAQKEKYCGKTKRTRRMTLAIALIAALLIAGGALALTRSGLLDHLFSGRTPPEGARALVKAVDRQAQVGDVTIRLDEYLYDGDTLALSYTLLADGDQTLLLSSSEAFCQVTDASGDSILPLSSWGEPWGWSLALGGALEDGTPLDQAIECGFQAVVPKQSRGAALNLSLFIDVYRPLYPLVGSDESAKKKNLVLANGEVSAAESEHNRAIFAAYREKRQDSGIEYASEADAYADAGLVEKVGTVTLLQTLIPQSAQAAKAHAVSLDAPIVLPLEEVTFTLKSLQFTATTSELTLVARAKDGASPDDRALDGWAACRLLNEKGELLPFSMGGTNFTAPDGAKSYRLSYSGTPFVQMPQALVFCPLRQDYVPAEGDRPEDQWDVARGVRLEIKDGKVVPPASSGLAQVIYAEDFAEDSPGKQSMRAVRERKWTAETLSSALLDAGSFQFDGEWGYSAEDGSFIIAGDLPGRFLYQSARLPDPYYTALTMLSGERVNLGGAVEGFAREDALRALDTVLDGLDLARGRIVSHSALSPDALKAAYVDAMVEGRKRWAEEAITDARVAQWERAAQFEIEASAPLKAGYLIRFALAYNGLSCVPEGGDDGNLAQLPTASGLMAFVNPDGVLWLRTSEHAAVYEAADADAGAPQAPITLASAKSVAEGALTNGRAGETVEIKRVFYEYAPLWAGEEGAQLTLCPAWNFYAARADGELYLRASVNAFTGKLIYAG